MKVDDYATSPAWRPYREHRRQFQRPTAQADPYNEILAATRSGDDSVPEAAVRLYRRLLAASPDGSVSICAIGTLTALAQLLRSRPDDVSRLPGRELVARKVRELTSMAAVQFSEGHEAFNWRMDGASAAAVLEGWPTAMTMSPRGDSVLTGARFIASAGPGQPVREAYVRYLGGVGRSRPSWDLIAALYAVRGLAGPFALSASRKLKFDPASAKYGWGELAAPTAPPRRLLEPILADAALAGMLEELMIASLEKACPHRTRRRR